MRPVFLPLMLMALGASFALQFSNWSFAVPALRNLQHERAVEAQFPMLALKPASGMEALMTGHQLGAARQSRGWHDPTSAPVDDTQWEAPVSALLAATTLAAVAASADASTASDGDDESNKSAMGKVWDTIKLPVYVGLWYFFNVQYNIQNKLLLKSFSATWAVSFVQLAAGIPIAMAMWATGLVQKPKVTSSDIAKLAPVGAAFAAGQVATVASLGAVAVSFTHVVKALEPAVNAMASALFLGQVFHPLVYLSLAPVFLGVGLASASELSFTMFGFLCAMASNFFFVARNVFATKFGKVGDMGTDTTTRKTNQLAVLTFVATAVLFPVALLLPGGLLSAPAAWNASIQAGVPAKTLMGMIASSGVYFFMYQLSSFWVLSCVQPITHSVLNTLKRIVIIIVSIVVFRNPVSSKSLFGTGLAIGGVLLYSLTKAHFAKKGK